MNKCYIFMGPSGSGKTTLAAAVFPTSAKIISFTTRKPRENEIDGQDYYFISKETFEMMIKNQELAEYDLYDHHYYGVAIASIKEALEKGDCYNALTPEGFWNLRKSFGSQIVPVFIHLSKETVAQRLMKRNSNDKDIRSRLAQYEQDHAAFQKLAILPELIVIEGDYSLTEMREQFLTAIQ